MSDREPGAEWTSDCAQAARAEVDHANGPGADLGLVVAVRELRQQPAGVVAPGNNGMLGSIATEVRG